MLGRPTGHAVTFLAWPSGLAPDHQLPRAQVLRAFLSGMVEADASKLEQSTDMPMTILTGPLELEIFRATSGKLRVKREEG